MPNLLKETIDQIKDGKIRFIKSKQSINLIKVNIKGHTEIAFHKKQE